MQKNRFIALDGIRGIAAIFVLFCHANNQELLNIFPHSYLSVDLFFMLSGFVISHTYYSPGQKPADTREFMLKRILRLYPLYILGITLGIVSFCAIHGDGFVDSEGGIISIVLGLFILPTTAGINTSGSFMAYPFNTPSWSIFYELIANFILASFANKLNKRTEIFIVSVCFLLLLPTAYKFHSLNFGPADYKSAILGGLVRVLFSFFTGRLMYRIWKSGKAAYLKTPLWAAALILGLAFSVHLPASMNAPYEVMIASCVFPVLVIGCSNVAVSGAMAWTCGLLGAASYAFYMLQVPLLNFLAVFAQKALKLNMAAAGPLGTLVCIFIVFGCAILADAFYDTPARRWVGQRVTYGLGRQRRG